MSSTTTPNYPTNNGPVASVQTDTLSKQSSSKKSFWPARQNKYDRAGIRK